MIEEILNTRKKKSHSLDLNIVPILDMLTTVIFFLLMSTTFIEYTKVTVPPAGTVSASGPNPEQPLAPKLMLRKAGSKDYVSVLSWGGRRPGKTEVRVNDENLRDKVMEQVKKFSEAFPSEKTLQVSLEGSIRYQALVSVMDGSHETMPDTVLISYADAEAR